MYLFLVKVGVHLPHVSVRVSVHGAAMDVEAKELVGGEEDTDVADGAEVHKLVQLVLHVALVHQKHIHSLGGRGKRERERERERSQPLGPLDVHAVLTRMTAMMMKCSEVTENLKMSL